MGHFSRRLGECGESGESGFAKPAVSGRLLRPLHPALAIARRRELRDDCTLGDPTKRGRADRDDKPVARRILMAGDDLGISRQVGDPGTVRFAETKHEHPCRHNQEHQPIGTRGTVSALRCDLRAPRPALAVDASITTSKPPPIRLAYGLLGQLIVRRIHHFLQMFDSGTSTGPRTGARTGSAIWGFRHPSRAPDPPEFRPRHRQFALTSCGMGD